LGVILFERMRLHEAVGRKSARKTKTGYSTDAEVLEELSQVAPIAARVLEFRQIAKLRNTYLETLPALVNPKTGRVHTTFRQTVAATGRLSSDNPNLQNIPIRTQLGREIRRAFVPDPGSVLISADYSQIELRLVAHFSGDAVLREAFARGEDIHRRTASVVFGVAAELVTSELRSRAKAINFGIIYGMGPQRLSRETGMTVPEAKKFIDAYFQRLPKVRGFLDEMLARAEKTGYAETIAGRKRTIPELASEDPRMRANAENIAVNTPIQGSAADIIKVAMLDVEKALDDAGMHSRMLLQVHDELVFEIGPGEREALEDVVRTKMGLAVALNVPLDVSVGVGRSWHDAAH
jgi:DNA polymerase-1